MTGCPISKSSLSSRGSETLSENARILTRALLPRDLCANLAGRLDAACQSYGHCIKNGLLCQFNGVCGKAAIRRLRHKFGYFLCVIHYSPLLVPPEDSKICRGRCG